ncbi:16S rRNA (uracil(1498)-N(3))-methyltransferase [Rheinheimera sp. MMS21-TC3]|uniref:16S rRNA (uracil(1498)-N(3))-methyltransferase n=1 Tax=Rheinheimera sp. MMS21-TC3 TaxID=3072790 RepID=UPI0028C4D966|nr:16S rRNA (uracil(1498)-N(3))-methyltransferase [Rheinheimera sp. MMS21-TC3]WNO60781.1 16S rRNA (uracil(1498)-N(3))-methyltransferase [Rheinheimera sp. MMS21-TC3]
MRIPRIYHSSSIELQQAFHLDDEAANHVGRVLRMPINSELVLFNGDGYNYQAKITAIDKKQIIVTANAKQDNPVESPLKIHLGQGISRGDRMDFAIQKAVELGVTEITPLFTERCGVKLEGERLAKRTQQWQKIVISACEQSGRSIVPIVHPAVSLTSWLAQDTKELKLTLHPRAKDTIKTLAAVKDIRLVIGPEGGFTDEEIALTTQADFKSILLGPRILRTETAALVTISALQLQFGDLA